MLWSHGRLADALKRHLGLHHGRLHEVLGPYGAEGGELMELGRLLLCGLGWDGWVLRWLEALASEEAVGLRL